MAKSASPISGIAERYAGSLFELARDTKSIDAVEKDPTLIRSTMNEMRLIIRIGTLHG